MYALCYSFCCVYVTNEVCSMCLYREILHHTYLPTTTYITLYIYLRYQPISVQWRPGFFFLRKGIIGSYTTLFTTQDLIEYGQNYDLSVVDEFMRCIHEYDDNSNDTDDVSEREVSNLEGDYSVET